MKRGAIDPCAGGVGPALSRFQRISAGLILSFCAVLVDSVGTASDGYFSEFSQIWLAIRALLDELDPYSPDVASSWVGQWGLPLDYPVPALLVAAPLAAFPLPGTQILLVTLSTSLLAFAVTRAGVHRSGSLRPAPSWVPSQARSGLPS